MSSGQTGWLVLMVMSIFLIVVGFQGDLGLVIGIIFCPQYILLQPDGGGGAVASFGTPGSPNTPQNYVPDVPGANQPGFNPTF